MRAKEIRELVRIVEESIIGELEITYWWGRKVRISKSTSAGSATRSGGIEIVTTSAPRAEHSVAATPLPFVHQSGPVAEKAVRDDNLLEIKAPMVGTFYRAPAPDAEPYIREGDMVAPGKVLCIIEAMKLMNEIEAEVNGKVVKILADNAQPVEYNQTLFLVEPVK